MRRPVRALVGAVLLAAGAAGAQARPEESSLFGEPEVAPDAGVPAAASPGADRDAAQLGAGPIRSKFDTEELKSDALKVGASLTLFGQGYFQEGRAFEQSSFSLPMVAEAYLDGRPNDRLRGFVLGRLVYDPTRPAQASSGALPDSASVLGFTSASGPNPSVALDQLWLRFDIARAVYVTVGRQKVRWGVSRIWNPTDFLNSQPRDPFNFFDTRLGANLLKVHVPVESLGWNFYAYGLLDSVTIDPNTGVSLNQLGGALRAELVLGPAELGLGAVWQKGRRPRYGIDLSSAVGPIDLYAEAAFRSSGDFTVFSYPDDLTADTAVPAFLAGRITGHHPGFTTDGVVVQVSGGASWQFNYTDKNSAVLLLEYFYNPVGYRDAVGFQVQNVAPGFLGLTLDSSQRTVPYAGQHNLALVLTAPDLPGADWISVALSNLAVLNDPSAMTRLGVTFRVLQYLRVEAFAAALYGQAGGQLRFSMTAREINALANLAGTTPAEVDALRARLANLRYPPVVLAGVVLQLSI